VRKLLKNLELHPDSSLMDKDLLSDALTPSQMEHLPESRERVKRHWDDLHRKEVQILSIVDRNYPMALKKTLGEQSPVLLLCVGNLELLRLPSVGFCGSREASEKGIKVASDCASLLAHERINVVSGYAAGVDMNAHRAALAAGGTTTVVLAEGILRFRVKNEIKAHWDDRRTLIISEFGPNLPWRVSNAMQRNKTICGLARALILIEARSTGGSIQAGRDCLRFGLPLFAAVYEGAPESATGNAELLGQGARRLLKSRLTELPNVRPILELLQA
jgi:DNA processing protein